MANACLAHCRERTAHMPDPNQTYTQHESHHNSEIYIYIYIYLHNYQAIYAAHLTNEKQIINTYTTRHYRSVGDTYTRCHKQGITLVESVWFVSNADFMTPLKSTYVEVLCQTWVWVLRLWTNSVCFKCDNMISIKFVSHTFLCFVLQHLIYCVLKWKL